ncbi:hypothetical protein C5613_33340 [Rhodococcus opacus]|uniref:Uncharacterized protein n=1 Tax=Rhodococcus opacus TaxID=37919 RepID=A0A2S8IT75_RHOOP|nr:hypothetical protein C5613_33340 [Rhodococcus opacus]
MSATSGVSQSGRSGRSSAATRRKRATASSSTASLTATDLSDVVASRSDCINDTCIAANATDSDHSNAPTGSPSRVDMTAPFPPIQKAHYHRPVRHRDQDAPGPR